MPLPHFRIRVIRVLRGSFFRGLALVLLSAAPAVAQTDGTCVPISERAGREFGCFITAREELGALSSQPPLFWHIESFPTVAAANAAKGPRGTVVESLGQVWLFTIAAADFKAKAGTHVTTIGPLPMIRADRYAAVYMEGVFKPGMSTQVHRHPGMEAWVHARRSDVPGNAGRPDGTESR